MNILFLTLEYPPQKGGVASYYFGLVEELKKQGHQVEIISDNLLSKFIWPRWIKAYFILRREIKKSKPDLIFIGQVLPLGNVAYLLRKKVPYVVFTHGMDVLMAQKSWRKKWVLKKILKQAKLVVTNSEFTKQQIKKLEIGNWKLEIEPTVVYPCPTVLSNIKQEEVELLRRKLGLTGKKVLLTLGRVVERKGHDLVIRALPEILEHAPNVIYVVAGAGTYLEKLVKITNDLKLQSVVRFVGEVLDNERALYFAMCDLFIMPSRQIGQDVEGFGLSFLEAAIFGAPSIGGLSGGMPEAILDGQTGALVDPNDSSALARVVVQLLRDDALRKELGNSAKTRIAHKFRWEKQTALLTEFLKMRYTN